MCVTRFDRFADHTSNVTSRATFFTLCFLLCVLWLPSFFFFASVDTWQLVMVTVTNVATFLLVALVQNTQWRNQAATAAKLDALAGAMAEFMRMQADADLSEEIDMLTASIGLEQRVTPARPVRTALTDTEE